MYLGNFLSGMETFREGQITVRQVLLGNFLSGMETDAPAPANMSRRSPLETSLVEWKHRLLRMNRLRRVDALETSLVEWKLAYPVSHQAKSRPWKLP